MKKNQKFYSSFIIFILLVMTVLPNLAYGTYVNQNDSIKQKNELAEKNKNIIAEFEESDSNIEIQDEVFKEDIIQSTNEVTAEIPVISYGPYVGGDSDQKNAYEPFKENELKENDPSNFPYKKDRVLIKFEGSISKSKSGEYQINGKTVSFEKLGITNIEPLVPKRVKTSKDFNFIKLSESMSKWHRAYIDEDTIIKDVVNKLKKDSSVISVEYDYIRQVEELGLPDPTTDENIDDQWYLDQLGIKTAWSNLEQQGINPGGSRDVVVAVIDTGVDYNHLDLKGNMWVNTGEIPNNGIDDDNNGFIDDIHGATTVGSRYSGESGNPLDDHGHGTHVAGIIAAQANNNEGGVGIAYNTQIMAIKAAQSSGVLSSSDIAQAIYYAVEKGADVINMSFGGYGRSTVEEDALQVAFGSSVLVASAGNNGKPNLPHIKGVDMFPAAYNWVLGVMAEEQNPTANGDYLAGFSNWDYISKDSHEYEVMAPGVDILSTLPDGQYAKWSGTSMAAPIVSGIAALVRSKYSDKSSYSSRFIMGQIASTGNLKQGITPLGEKPLSYYEPNALSALTNTPKPKLSYLEHYVFDTNDIAEGNDGDGVVDAGETIDIAMVIRNHWGKADNVQVKIDTKSSAGLDDPYVTFVTDTVNYGAVGNFAIDDNGLIYNEEGVVTGVNLPFRLQVSPHTPNDHIIPINIILTANNGFDTSDTTIYTFKSQISSVVRNGTELPGVISENMTLTKDKYWIVPNATLIQEGATVTVEPGTQIQFWSSEAEGPYAEKTMAYIEVRGDLLINGTAEDPVEMFPSGLYPGYEVKIYSTSSLDEYGRLGSYRGYAEINYAKVMNPNIAVQKVDHSYFSQDLFERIYKRYLYNGEVQTTYSYGPFLKAKLVSNSKFYSIGSNPYHSSTISDSRMFRIEGKTKGNLFDSSLYYMDEQWAEDNVYLKNYKLYESQYGGRTYWMSKGKNFGSSINIDNSFQSVFPVKFNDNGSTYFAVKPNIPFANHEEMEMLERYANEFGGHIVTINDEEENEFLRSYVNNYLFNSTKFNEEYPDLYYNSFQQDPIIGLNDFENENVFTWINGETVNYTNWSLNEPNNIYNADPNANFVRLNSYSGEWYDSKYNYYGNVYILEVPGISNVTGVTLDKEMLTLGEGGASAELSANISPGKATNKNTTWSSLDLTVATVDENGVVTPIKIGTTTITVTTEDGGFTASSEVNVIEIVPATGVTLDKSTLELAIGEQQLLTAKVLPEDATDKRVVWTSSNETVATIDENGKFLALSEGTTTITVTSLDGNFSDQASISVVVPVEGIQLDQEFLRLVLGDAPTKLTPIISPENATNQNVEWSSSNKAVVTVDEIGNVTPVGKGTVMITAKTLNGGYTATSIVTVWETAVNFITDKVSAGSSHTLAINDDGTAWAWGSNGNGKLGDGTTEHRLTPVKVQNIDNALDIAAGGAHSLLLKNDGTVWAWGYNNYGQTSGSSYTNTTPKQVGDLSGVKAIAAGSLHSVALKSDGTVWTWGYNGYGQLGDGTTIRRSTPVQVSNLTNVVDITASDSSTIALKADGTVWAWGYNEFGQLGDGTYNNSTTPVQVKNISNITEIDAGYYHAIALGDDGTVWGWGYASKGQLGNGGGYRTPTPVQANNLTNVVGIAAGGHNSIALTSDGSVWTYGNNEYGQLGNGNTSSSYYPNKVEELTATSISAGLYHSVVTKDDGTIWSWGYNSYGQLGNLTTENSYEPVQTLFGILPDNEAPILISTDPEEAATNVPVTSSISFTFNESIRTGDNFALITLKDQNNNVLSLRSKTIDGSVITLEPINGLVENTNYTVSIPSSSLTDMFNNNYSSSISLSFSTASSQSTALLLENLSRFTENKNWFGMRKIERGTDRQIEDSKTDSILIGKIDTTANSYNKQISINNVTSITAEDTLTQQDIDLKRVAFIESGILSTIKNNAILNRWWDPNVDHWMRFTSEEGEYNKRFLSNNYWGTTSTELIEKSLIHFNDFRNMEEIIFEPILTVAPETAYPFVTDAYVSTQVQERATKVGAELITVHVKFNRDMDITMQPQVSFGPDVPQTDYSVHGVNGGWITPRHWSGEFNINSMTGDGYQFFRVAGAVAADDPWLVTGNDTERFRFEIVTSGTEAMNLQASGGEGKNLLSWTQDDFDTLAGYNLYRSEQSNGTYVKINKTVIPSDKKSFEDTEVEPGKPYFYKFKVVKTDLTESEFSNVASATPIDTIPPVITHTPIKKADVGMSQQIYADVTDNVLVDKVTLFYRQANETAFKEKEMVKSTNNRYSTTLEGSLIQAPWLDYYIEASDGISLVRNGSVNQPHQILVTDEPTITSISPAEGAETGGTAVIISGSNFKEGASITFGQAIASSVVVESSNRITAVTPSHYPANVDITVTNPDGAKDTILRGFTYLSEGIEVSISDVTGNVGDIIEVPVYVQDVSGLRSADLKVSFDQNLLTVKEVKLGSLSSNFTLATNKSVSGEVTLSMASATSVSGTGTLATISFIVEESETTSTALTLSSIELNSGSIIPTPVNGAFSIAIGNTYAISGSVKYYNNSRAVSGVTFNMIGNENYAGVNDVNGQFTINNIVSGDYVLKPVKTDEISGISAYDASLILQASVGITNLSVNQQIAADVDQNGVVDALDAAYVLEKAVNLIDLPFPGAGKVWTFTPEEKSFTNLANDYSYQDFTAILLGDVNGDWGETTTSNLKDSFSIGSLEKDSFGGYKASVNFDLGEAQLYSTNLVLTYDKTSVKPVLVNKSKETSENGLAVNFDTPGQIEIALAGAQPVSGKGILADIYFESIDGMVKETPLKIEKAKINDATSIIKTLSADKPDNQVVGTKIIWKVNAEGQDLKYAWVVYKGEEGILRKRYSSRDYLEWTPSESGTYRVKVSVTDAHGNVISKQSEDFTIAKSDLPFKKGKNLTSDILTP